jgi:hypothetical protein
MNDKCFDLHQHVVEWLSDMAINSNPHEVQLGQPVPDNNGQPVPYDNGQPVPENNVT